jgi:hypothetical protein
VLEHSISSVAPEELNQFVKWTTEFGQEGWSGWQQNWCVYIYIYIYINRPWSIIKASFEKANNLLQSCTSTEKGKRDKTHALSSHVVVECWLHHRHDTPCLAWNAIHMYISICIEIYLTLYRYIDRLHWKCDWPCFRESWKSDNRYRVRSGEGYSTYMYIYNQETTTRTIIKTSDRIVMTFILGRTHVCCWCSTTWSKYMRCRSCELCYMDHTLMDEGRYDWVLITNQPIPIGPIA